MLAAMLPICFILTVLLVKVVILIYNKTQQSLYELRLKKLTDRQDALQRELANIKNKKIN
jgi:hypothetical protein